jgi:hypothetical protein
VYEGKGVKYDLEFIPYSSYRPLRDFLTPVVKHIENALRNLANWTGRLHGIKIDPELASVIDSFLKSRYGSLFKKANKESNNREIVLNDRRIQELFNESTEVQAMLTTPDGIEELTDDPDVGTGINCRQIIEQGPDQLPSDLESLVMLLKEMNYDEKCIISRLQENGWKMDLSHLNSISPGVLIDRIINHINDRAIDILGSILIAQEGQDVILEEDYREMLLQIGTNPKTTDESASLKCLALKAESLCPEWKNFIMAMEDRHIQSLRAILFSDQMDKELLSISDSFAIMPETILDEINEAALSNLGDIIIDTSIRPISISLDYRELLLSVLNR